MATSKCRDCDGEMLWATKEETGTGVPLEPNPRPDGNYVLIALQEGGKPLVRYVKHGETLDPGALRYIAHPKVCSKRPNQAPAARPAAPPRAKQGLGQVNRMMKDALHGEDDYGGNMPGRGRGPRGSRRTGGRRDGLKGSQRKRRD